MLLVYVWDEAADIAAVVTIQDARSATRRDVRAVGSRSATARPTPEGAHPAAGCPSAPTSCTSPVPSASMAPSVYVRSGGMQRHRVEDGEPRPSVRAVGVVADEGEAPAVGCPAGPEACCRCSGRCRRRTGFASVPSALDVQIVPFGLVSSRTDEREVLAVVRPGQSPPAPRTQRRIGPADAGSEPSGRTRNSDCGYQRDRQPTPSPGAIGRAPPRSTPPPSVRERRLAPA